MAYLAFAEGSSIGGQVAGSREPAETPVDAEVSALSPLEWLVIAVAKGDRLSSLRTPGRLSSALGTLFGPRPNPRLADERLEALRRIAVLSWHYGYVVPSREVNRFFAAGFSPDQYERVVDSIGADRLARGSERFRR